MLFSFREGLIHDRFGSLLFRGRFALFSYSGRAEDKFPLQKCRILNDPDVFLRILRMSSAGRKNRFMRRLEYNYEIARYCQGFLFLSRRRR